MPSNTDPEHAPLSSKEELAKIEPQIRAKRQTHVRSDSGVKVLRVIINETLEKAIFELDGNLEKNAEYYFQVNFFHIES